MTYSLAIANGDLVKNGDQLAIVYGVDKLKQDMTCWLVERYGGNKFHTDHGSILEEYIGKTINSNTQAQIYSEILRVLHNYQSRQYRAFTANPSLFALSELMYSIDHVDIKISYDTVKATISVSNPASTATVTISPTSL